MHPRHLIAALAVTGIGIVATAGTAGATNASVAYGQTCDTATVSVTSQWDGGTIHVVITGPSPAIGLDVPPLKTASSTFRIIPNPLTVTLTSSNGHLLGDLTHTFTADGCGQPTTTTSSTLPGIVPGAPTTGATTSVPTTSTAPAPTTNPASPSPTTTGPTSLPTTTPSAGVTETSSVHSTPTQLPTTGSGDAVPLVAIGVGILVAGVLMLAVRRRSA